MFGESEPNGRLYEQGSNVGCRIEGMIGSEFRLAADLRHIGSIWPQRLVFEPGDPRLGRQSFC